ncbi:hypothetical protein TNCV_2535121 [Trichonephila clavipes]|nr:hypothetical protein TNCV_2535121 [Trichonephila clavipes]
MLDKELWRACLKRIMSSFLVLREGDNRNRWRDGQVCPDVGQRIMAPWARRPGRREESCPGSKKHERRALVGTDLIRVLRKLEWKGRKDYERRWH